jgi:RNA polymerase sigma factor (sigma-70 family)
MSEQFDPIYESPGYFPTTDWGLICDAQLLTQHERRDKLETLIQHYWKPVYAFYRSHGQTVADAEDAVQGLFASLVEGDKISNVAEPQGRFRDWLVACARNYLRDRHRRDNALKRRPRKRVVSLEELKRVDGAAFEPTAEFDSEQAVLDAWRRELLRRAIDAVWHQCVAKARQTDFCIFADYYMGDDGVRPTWKLIAARHQLTDWKQASHRAEWVKAQLHRAVRRLIAEYVSTEEEVDEELRTLIG